MRWQLLLPKRPVSIANSLLENIYILEVGDEGVEVSLRKLRTEYRDISWEDSTKDSGWWNTDSIDNGRGLISDNLWSRRRVNRVGSTWSNCKGIGAWGLAIAIDCSYGSIWKERTLLNTVSIGEVSACWVEEVGIRVILGSSRGIPTGNSIWISGSEDLSEVSGGICGRGHVNHRYEHGSE